MSIFSPELIDRCKKYYIQKYELELTSEQSEVFLLSLANLYLLVTENTKKQSLPVPNQAQSTDTG